MEINKKELIIKATNKGFVSVKGVIFEEEYFYLWMCELQQWLRNMYQIKVFIFDGGKGYFEYLWSISYQPHGKLFREEDSDKTYSTYEESLYYGLIKALTLT